MSDKYFLFVGIILALISLFLLVLKVISLFKCSQRIEGHITGTEDMKTLLRGSTIHHYHPVCEYEVNGEKFAETAPYSSRNEEKYKKGDTVIMYMNPKNPRDVRFPYFDGSIIVDLAFLAMGITLVVCYFL